MPSGFVCPAAAVPMATKIPAPIARPIARMISSPPGSTRFGECAPAVGRSDWIGFQVKSCDIPWWRCYQASIEPVRGFVRHDSELTARAEGHADEAGARCDEL